MNLIKPKEYIYRAEVNTRDPKYSSVVEKRPKAFSKISDRDFYLLNSYEVAYAFLEKMPIKPSIVIADSDSSSIESKFYFSSDKVAVQLRLLPANYSEGRNKSDLFLDYVAFDLLGRISPPKFIRILIDDNNMALLETNVAKCVDKQYILRNFGSIDYNLVNPKK